MMCRHVVTMLLAPGLLFAGFAQNGAAAEQGTGYTSETHQEVRSQPQPGQQENRQSEKLRLRQEMRQQRHQQHRLQSPGSVSLGSTVGPTHGRR